MNTTYKQGNSILMPIGFIRNELYSAPDNELRFFLSAVIRSSKDMDGLYSINNNEKPYADYWIEKGYILPAGNNRYTIDFKENNDDKDDNSDAYHSFVDMIEDFRGSKLNRFELEDAIFICRELSLPSDVVLYLAEYCLSRGKSGMAYIKAVAIAWDEQKIKTVEEAKARKSKYPSDVYNCLKMLGRKDNIAPAEKDTVLRWFKEYGMDKGVIYEAISRTLQSGVERRLLYCDAIIDRWRRLKVKHVEDIPDDNITYADESAKNNGKELDRKYDFNAIEAKIANRHWNRK